MLLIGSFVEGTQLFDNCPLPGNNKYRAFFRRPLPCDNNKYLLPQGVAELRTNGAGGSHINKLTVCMPLPLLHGGGRETSTSCLERFPQRELLDRNNGCRGSAEKSHRNDGVLAAERVPPTVATPPRRELGRARKEWAGESFCW